MRFSHIRGAVPRERGERPLYGFFLPHSQQHGLSGVNVSKDLFELVTTPGSYLNDLNDVTQMTAEVYSDINVEAVKDQQQFADDLRGESSDLTPRPQQTGILGWLSGR